MFRESGVEEPGRVRVPGDRDELRPLEVVAEIRSVRDIANADVLPVAAATRERVDDVAPVRAWLPLRQRDRSVAGQRVRVEQHASRAMQTILDVEHRLVLQPRVEGKEVTRAAGHRRGWPWVI